MQAQLQFGLPRMGLEQEEEQEEGEEKERSMCK